MTALCSWDRKRWHACMKGMGVIKHRAFETYNVSCSASYLDELQQRRLVEQDEDRDSASSELLVNESILEEEEEDDDEGQVCEEACSA